MQRRGLLSAAAATATLMLLSCGPTIAPCSPESCAGGCCDPAGVCVAGRHLLSCGAGGLACSVCQDVEVCPEGRCVARPADAGIDAGVLDAGEDAGALDAGRLRTVVLTRTAESYAPDGGVAIIPNSLLGATVTLFYEDPRGDVVTVAGQNDGASARFAGVPEGPWLILYRAAGATVSLLVASDADALNVGPKVAGRRAPLLTSPATLTIDAGLPEAWAPGDYLTATSQSAGMVRDSFTLSRSGDASVFATGDLSAGQLPFGLAAGDDLTLTINRVLTDAGTAVASAAYFGVTLAAPALGAGQSATLTPTFSVLPREGADLTVRSSDFAQFIGEANPAATPSSHRVQVTSTFVGGGVDGGGDPDGRSARLFSFSRGGSADLTGSFTWGNPFGAAAPGTVFKAVSTAIMPVTYQGKTQNLAFEAMSTTRLASAVSSLGPEMSPPRFVRLNGETAFINRNGVSTTPELEWAAPSLGTPNRYDVNLWRVTVGTTLQFTFVAQLTTPFTRARLPPGLLLPGEAYFAYVVATRVRNNDVRTTSNRSSRETEDALAVTNVFTP